jgi:hypothetical protein
MENHVEILVLILLKNVMKVKVEQHAVHRITVDVGVQNLSKFVLTLVVAVISQLEIVALVRVEPVVMTLLALDMVDDTIQHQ